MHSPERIFHRFNDAVLIESFEGQVLDANAKACELYGYSSDEFLGLPVARLVPEAERGKIQQVSEKVSARHPFLLPVLNQRKNGEVFPAEVSGAEVEFGGRRAMAIVVRDVTAHRQLEERLRDTLAHLERIVDERTRDLRASEERYRYLYEQASDILFETDVEGHFIRINRAAEVITGYSREEIEGQPFSVFLDSEDLPRAQHQHLQSLAGLTMRQPLEVRLRAKDGCWLVLEYKESPRYQGEAIIGTHGVARDITEKKQAERRARETEQLVTLGQLVTSIAHEIRNPLFGISCIAQILSNHERNEEGRELFEAMLGEINRLNHLISELLHFGKPRQPKTEPLLLPALIEDLLRLHGAAIQNKQLAVKTEWPSALELISDGRLLQQVLNNLFLNAIYFSPPQRELRICVQALSPTGGPNEVRIGVHNFGKAIPAADRGRVYELFYSTREDGIGLGLSVCRQLVHNLGGEIDFESDPESGTWFWISLPNAGTGKGGSGDRGG